MAFAILLGLHPNARADSTVVEWGDSISYDDTGVPADLTNVVAVAAGGVHSLALSVDGTVIAWGLNWWGQTDVPADLTNVVAVAAGWNHSVALKNDGTVIAWGDNSSGQTNVPPGLTNVVAVAAGGENTYPWGAGWGHCLALRDDGTVVAWGANNDGQTNVPPGLDNVVMVAAGGSHCLALNGDGTVAAWGDNYQGQTNVPSGLTNVVAVAAGWNHSLALKNDGTVVAWGANSCGELDIPPGLSNVVAVAARSFGRYYPSQGGSQISLALTGDGTVVAWGGTWYLATITINNGYFGYFYQTNVYVPTTVPSGLSNVVVMAAGGDHNLALVGSGLPRLNLPLEARSLLAGGGQQTCLRVEAVGTPPFSYQWRLDGTNIEGATNSGLRLSQAGAYSVAVSNALGQAISGEVPVSVLPLRISKQPSSNSIFSGGSVSFSVVATGVEPFAYQWGFNGTNLPGATNATLVFSNAQFSQAGNYAVTIANQYGSAQSLNAWLEVENVCAGQTTVPLGLTNVVAVAAGISHSLALKSDGTVVAWGDDHFGETNIPSGLTNVVAVAACYLHSLALTSDGTVVAWGDTYYGQPISGLSNVVAVAAGGWQDLALKSDGTVAAWAGNPFSETTVPSGLTNVIAVAANWGKHCLALKGDGTVVAWGDNTYGQINVPLGLTSVVAVAAGWNHNLVLKSDGTVVAWGDNTYGQINVPPGLTNVVAVAAGASHSLALTSAGMVVAWGDNSHGQTTVLSGLTNVVAIAAGDYCSLALVGRGLPRLNLPLVARSLVTGIEQLYLRVEAVGAPPFSYQWRLNGTNIDGATNSLLLLQDVSFDQAGAYSVAVSNAVGQAISGDVPVSVVPLRISTHPSSTSACVGGLASIPASAIGVGALTYQWLFNGNNLPGATNLTLVITNAQRVQSGYYSVIVANQYDSVQSLSAWLEVQYVGAWGDNYFGQATVPLGLSNVVAVAAGGCHSLALKIDGAVVAWGDNTWDQATVPIGLSNVVAVAAGMDYSLALKGDGTVVEWGSIYTPVVADVPPGLNNVVAVAAGSVHSLALKRDGTVVAWGVLTNIPSGLSNVVAVAAGGNHSLALKGDGTVFAWGDNTWDQATVPFGLSNVVAVAAGGDHSLVLKGDGTVFAWGDNSYGQTNVPSGLTNVVAVTARSYHSLALKSDGTVVAWGAGLTNIPTGLTNVVAVAAGYSHSLALIDSSPLIGGSPLQGRLGNPFVSGGRFHLTIAGLAGTRYQYILEQSADLQHWTPTQTNTLPGGGRQWVVPTGTNHQFFRTRTINAPPP